MAAPDRSPEEFRAMDAIATKRANERGRWPTLSPPLAAISFAGSSYLVLLIFCFLAGVHPERVAWTLALLPAIPGVIALLVVRQIQSRWSRRHAEALEQLEQERVAGRAYR